MPHSLAVSHRLDGKLKKDGRGRPPKQLQQQQQSTDDASSSSKVNKTSTNKKNLKINKSTKSKNEIATKKTKKSIVKEEEKDEEEEEEEEEGEEEQEEEKGEKKVRRSAALVAAAATSTNSARSEKKPKKLSKDVLMRECLICKQRMHQDEINEHYTKHYTQSPKCCNCRKVSTNSANFITHVLSHLRKSHTFIRINYVNLFLLKIKIFNKYKNRFI